MLGHYRTHQEQLRQTATLMKTLYDKKKASSETRSATPENPKPASASSYGFGIEKLTSFRQSSRLMKKIAIGIRCPVCGELFPPSDFQYTEGTGLCIRCWEKGVLSCP